MQTSRRTEDELIYNKALYIKEPKEIFKKIIKLSKRKTPYKKILDIGCANGAFLHFIKSKYPNATLHGWDISKKLLRNARKNIKEGCFLKKDVSRPISKIDKFDLIVSTGVTGCFQKIEPFLQNIARSLKAGGKAFIAGNFNEYPLRVFISYNDITKHLKNHKEEGWNIFCVQEVFKALKKIQNLKIKFHNFEMPFDLKKKKNDYARTWTIKIKNKRQTTNGLCVIWPHKILEINKQDA